MIVATSCHAFCTDHMNVMSCLVTKSNSISKCSGIRYTSERSEQERNYGVHCTGILQCKGENWSPVQEYYSYRLAGVLSL